MIEDHRTMQTPARPLDGADRLRRRHGSNRPGAWVLDNHGAPHGGQWHVEGVQAEANFRNERNPRVAAKVIGVNVPGQRRP